MISSAMERDLRTKAQEVADLEADVRYLRSQLRVERLARAQAEADAARLRRAARRGPVVPGGDPEGGYECGSPYCNASLDESWRYCPMCGCEVDWRTWADLETGDPDAYDRRFDR